jgi:3-hydroxy acid dehydrogenase / malonic semialdehyde reductase
MKTIFITGATSGFGAACARHFAKNGWRVVATGRKEKLLNALAKELSPAPAHTAILDVRDREAVFRVVDELPGEFSQVDVLLNNAGLALGLDPAQTASLDDWDEMVDANIKGILHCTRAILPGMVERDAGHIINLGSIAGSYPYPSANVYGGTKAFVKQFTLNLMADLVGTKVRASNIEPAMAETNFSVTRFHGDKGKADSVYAGMTPLSADDIAETVYWVASRPAHVNISRVELWPVNQACGMFNVHRKKD